MKNIIENSRKIFGFLYFLFNALFLAVIVILIANGLNGKYKNPGWEMLPFPLLGVFVGHWIRRGQFGWWRTGLILISLLCAAAAVYVGFFIPALLSQ